MRYLLARQGIIENFIEIDEGEDNGAYFALMAQEGVAVAPVERAHGDVLEVRNAELGDGYDAREDAILREGVALTWEPEVQEAGAPEPVPPLTMMLSIARSVTDAPAEAVNRAVMALAFDLGYTQDDARNWEPGKIIRVDDEVMFEGREYACLQAHIAQADWTPDVAASLFTLLGAGAEPGPWVAGEAVEVGWEREYDGVWYVCRQGHTTQVGWEPPRVAALWVKTR